MRQWQARPDAGYSAAAALGGIIRALGDDAFQSAVLDHVQAWLPAASWSVYRTGPHCRPALYLSGSRGIPDRTRDCWWAYLSGPYLHDSSFGGFTLPHESTPRLCHVTALEVPAEHRMRVYDAHGVMERVSVVDQDADAVFAVNFYRHAHQPAFTDAQIASFEGVAQPVLELARKHVALSSRVIRPAAMDTALDSIEARTADIPPGRLRERLLELGPELTARELDVCVRLLQGMTHDGIAVDLGVSLTTVKTYRNRAFDRLGIHFRNELFARVLRLRPTDLSRP
jgi:DNA-binding CsgD family transcriptional regulator